MNQPSGKQQYDRSPEFDQAEEGQIIDTPEVGTLALLNKSEIDQQITTAKRFPRSIKQFLNDAIELATLDEQTAAECIYSLPRDGKAITGPSARLAEIILYSWTNVRGGARVVSEDGDFVTAQGAFYDLQNNVAIAYEVKRRIIDKSGRRFKPDMIGVTANAACSIALRNAVLKGVPKALWRKVEDAARKTIVGDIKTLASKRQNALQQFQVFGVTADMLYRVLGIKGVDDIGIDELVTLAGMLTALKEGDTTVEEMFAQQSLGDPNLAAKSTKGLDEIKARQKATNGETNGKLDTAAISHAVEDGQALAKQQRKMQRFEVHGCQFKVYPSGEIDPQNQEASNWMASQNPQSASTEPSQPMAPSDPSSASETRSGHSTEEPQGVPLTFE